MLEDTAQVNWLGLRVGGHPALSLHSSDELGELSQWLGDDDNTTIVVVIISVFTIIIIIQMELILCSRPMDMDNMERAPVNKL